MAKKTYTYEDWLEDKPYFNASDQLSDGYSVPSGMNLSGYNELVRNTPEWLYEIEGVIQDKEYELILQTKHEVCLLMRNYFVDKVESYIDSYIDKVNDKSFVYDNRYRVITDYLRKPEFAQLVHAVARSKPVNLPISGSKCIEIKGKLSNSEAIEPLYILEKEKFKEGTLFVEKKGKRVHPYFMCAVLYKEKESIFFRRGEQILTTERILENYGEIEKREGGSKATFEIWSWLVDELGISEDTIKKKYKLTLNNDSMRKRYQRYRESKKINNRAFPSV